MERRNDISNLLAIYIRNTREIYDITTWLQNCLIKKINNGIQPQVEYLENCRIHRLCFEQFRQKCRPAVGYPSYGILCLLPDRVPHTVTVSGCRL